MKHTRRAFTLIELIVCVTLILILVAILFPVFNRAKQRAKSTVCTSNLQQVYLALKLYQQDHGEYPPNSFSWPGFKPYYPVILECPVSLEQFPEYDYFAMWAGPQDPERAAWRECKEKRDGRLPLSLDSGHVNPETGFAEYFIILRENVSVTDRKIDGKNIPGLECDVDGWLYFGL